MKIHVAKVFIASLLANGPNGGQRGKPITRGRSTNQEEDSQYGTYTEDSQYGIYTVVDVYRNVYSNVYSANILIEDNVVRFEMDSGSSYSFLSRSQFEKLSLANKLTSTKNKFIPDGKVRVNMK